MGERLKYIDYAKGLGIIFIVIGHILTDVKWLIDWVYSFHVPLFFLITGIILGKGNGEKTPFIKKTIKLIKAILIPYVAFCIINQSLSVLLGFKELNLTVLKQDIFLILIGIGTPTLGVPGGTAIWFLSALFIAELIFMGIIRIKGIIIRNIVSTLLVAGAISVGDSILILTPLVRGIMGFSYVYIGFLLAKKFKNTKYEILRMDWKVGIAFLFINVITFILNNRVDLYVLDFNNPLLYYVESISGSLFILFVCGKLEKINIKFLTYIGKNSIIIQCTHSLLSAIVYMMFTVKTGVPAQLINTVLVLLLELPLIYIITNYCGFIIGRKSLKRIKKAD